MKARENPFAMVRLERLKYRLEAQSWPRLFERFERLGRRAALVGPHGSGKTTLAAEWAEYWQQAGGNVCFVRLSADASSGERWAGLAAALAAAEAQQQTLMILDGAEQLSWLGWRRFLSRAKTLNGLLITTHRPGRLPTLHECRTSPALLEELVRELIPERMQWERLGQSSGELFRRHEGNLRDALRELYDVWSRLGGRIQPVA